MQESCKTIIEFKKSLLKLNSKYEMHTYCFSHSYMSYVVGIVITDPRTEAEVYQFSNKKFKSDVASSGISLQDVQMSSMMGFHSMSEDPKKENNGPRFDIKTMRRTITAINGKSIELSCSVIDLGNKTVSHPN